MCWMTMWCVTAVCYVTGVVYGCVVCDCDLLCSCIVPSVLYTENIMIIIIRGWYRSLQKPRVVSHKLGSNCSLYCPSIIMGILFTCPPHHPCWCIYFFAVFHSFQGYKLQWCTKFHIELVHKSWICKNWGTDPMGKWAVGSGPVQTLSHVSLLIAPWSICPVIFVCSSLV